MKVANGILAVALFAMAFLVRHDIVLCSALCATAILTLLTLLPSVRQPFIRVYAAVNTCLMFFYFYTFFAAVPLLEHSWFLQLEYAHHMVVLVAGIASMHILADNSCCLKRTLETPIGFEWPRFWTNWRERIA
ncbi:MAG: hypothetical protein F4W90_11235 [Gammaproteobacteria bacterium]|nr:hypothetical protein [Gammaproteobacteria bacterium]